MGPDAYRSQRRTQEKDYNITNSYGAVEGAPAHETLQNEGLHWLPKKLTSLLKHTKLTSLDHTSSLHHFALEK